jgi:hypothetical protein
VATVDQGRKYLYFLSLSLYGGRQSGSKTDNHSSISAGCRPTISLSHVRRALQRAAATRSRASPRASCRYGDGLGWENRHIRITNVSPRSWAPRHFRFVSTCDAQGLHGHGSTAWGRRDQGRAREAEESKDGDLPKLTLKQVLYLGYGTAPSVLCDDPQEMYLKGRSSTPCCSS